MKSLWTRFRALSVVGKTFFVLACIILVPVLIPVALGAVLWFAAISRRATK